MLHLILGTILILLTPESSEAQELRIFLNTNDCVNCTSALNSVSGLPISIHTTIFCDESKRRFIPDVLSQNNVVESSNVKIAFIKTKSLEKRSPVESMCEFRFHEKLIFTFPLREFKQHIPSIEAFTQKYSSISRLTLPDGLNISDRSTFYSYEDVILVSDYVSSKTFDIRIVDEDSLTYKEVTLDNYFKNTAMQNLELDLSRYDSFAERLKKEKAFNPEIKSLNQYGDTLYTLTTLWYPDPDPEDSSSALLTPHPVFFAMKDERTISSRGCQNFIPDSVGDYLIMYEYGFSIQREFICIPLFKRGVSNTPIYLFGKFVRADMNAEFSDFLKIQPPRDVIANGPLNQYYMGRINGDLYSMKIYPFFHDINSSISFDASELISKEKTSFFVNHQPLYWTYDARWISDGVLLTLCSFENKVWLYWFDTKNRNIIRKTEIDTKDVLNETMSINSNGSIVGMSKSYSQIIVIK